MPTPDQYIIQKTTMDGIANAVRGMRHEKGTMTPAQIEAKIRASSIGVSNDSCVYDHEWVRPADWPDIDALVENLNDTDEIVYFTYDFRKTPGNAWLAIYVAGGASELSRGHIENGAFVADESYTSTGSVKYRGDVSPEENTVQLFRLRATGDNHITRVSFRGATSTSSNNQQNNMQPCVERVGQLPYMTSAYSQNSTGGTTDTHCTMWMEHDGLVFGTKSAVTDIRSAWNLAYNLQKLDTEKFDTSNWTITSLYYTWRQCYKLRKLDLSGWVTTNWAITSLNSAWYACASLIELKISNWNTSNWAVTNFGQPWTYCFALKELDLSGWDTENWAVTTLTYAWAYCYSLQSLNISSWDTSGWGVTSCTYVWYSCMSLIQLDLSGWDTSGWVVTSLNNCWSGCYSLRELNVSTWDTSGWAVTDLGSCWNGCYALLELDISNWDVSEWAVTSLVSTWNSCRSLRELDISEWDTSNWAVTSLASTWYNCYSLNELDISDWDTSNWIVDNMASAFAYCYGLQSLDLSDWDTRNWTLSNTSAINYITRELWTIKELKFPSGMYRNDKGTNLNQAYPCLEYFNGWEIDVNHSYSSALLLTRESLISIISKLPTVSSKTITLGQSNKLKLTAEEIAVATQKGWTVA